MKLKIAIQELVCIAGLYCLVVSATSEDRALKLVNAAADNNHALVLELLNSGVDVNSMVAVPYTAKKTLNVSALHWTVMSRAHPRMVPLLVSRGADPNLQDGLGETVLHKAVATGDLVLVELLVEKMGSKVDVKNKAGESAMFVAAKLGHTKIVKYLLSKGDSVSSRDNNLETVLHEAAASGNTELIEYLVSIGAPIDAKNQWSETPLTKATFRKKLESVKKLLTLGANINSLSDGGKTPLHVAAEFGNKEITAYLLTKGADPEKRDTNDDTPLQLAVERKNLGTVQELLNKGAKINTQGFLGRTPLYRAASNGDYKMVKFLISKKADGLIADSLGETPLHAAARNGHKDVASLLLASGQTELFKNDRKGRNPLELAKEYKQTKVVELLERYYIASERYKADQNQK